MKVQILGTGCAKCKALYAEAEKAIAQAGVEVELEKVEKIDEIAAFGVAMTPGLVIDGEVKSVGKISKASKIAEWLAAAKK